MGYKYIFCDKEPTGTGKLCIQHWNSLLRTDILLKVHVIMKILKPIYQANLYCRRKFLVSRPLVFTFWNKLYLDMISKCWQKNIGTVFTELLFQKSLFHQCNFQLECHLLAIDVTKMQILIYHVITNLFLFLKLRGYSHDCSCGRRRNTCKHALSNYDISVIGS